MAEHHRPQAGLDSGGKGQQIPAFQFRKGAVIHHPVQVGISVFSVAGEMLHHASHAVLRHPLQALGNELSGGFRIRPQGAAVEKGAGPLGNVAHRCQVHIQPQVTEKKGLFRFQTQHQFKAALFIKAPGGGKGFRPKGFEPADPGDGAALLVHGQKHRDPAGCLEGTELLP